MRSMHYKQREAGVVSLLVTMIMMIVITLIVLGFAEIARNEQRSALDEQLSTQAYYAAESGINDVRDIINATVAAGGQVASKNICGDQNGYTLNGTGQSTVDATHSVGYTCVLVNASPTTISYTTKATSTVIPLQTGGAAIGSLNLTWYAGDNLPSQATNCPTSAQNPVATSWACNYPMLRVDIVDAAVLSRAGWSGSTSTIFFEPFNSVTVGSNVAFGAKGTVQPARCNTSCSANITGLGGASYYMRVVALYRSDSKLDLTAAGNKPFTNAQAIIDATGKAQDVLRRVVVAVDLTDANAHNIPGGAIVSRDNICKQFGITNKSFTVYNDLTTGGTSDPYCNPASSFGVAGP